MMVSSSSCEDWLKLLICNISCHYDFICKIYEFHTCKRIMKLRFARYFQWHILLSVLIVSDRSLVYHEGVLTLSRHEIWIW